MKELFNKCQKKELLRASISHALKAFIFVGIILGIIAYSKTKKINNYYLGSDGEIIYCNSPIWIRINKETNKPDGSLSCNYQKTDDWDKYKYIEWDGKYPEKYFSKKRTI